MKKIAVVFTVLGLISVAGVTYCADEPKKDVDKIDTCGDGDRSDENTQDQDK
jgi:hypothetical protein